MCVSRVLKSIGSLSGCQRDYFPMPARLFCKAFRSWDLRLLKIAANIFFMPTISQQLVAKLLAASNLLRDALAELESPQTSVSDAVRAQVQRLIAEGKCLNGGHAVPDGMDVVRGMCRDCYNAANNAKLNGETSEAELVARGLEHFRRLVIIPQH